ncbi:hypothetical protein C8Q79DRAFT_654636 [Trametes meyenii]|nr:hypothetical protein C8Q79DRAFT_654636 [Trametes meyenii]
MPIKLSPLSCERLRCSDDGAILKENPIVRILVLEEIAKQRAVGGVEGHKAFVTDGATYTHILISPALSTLVGDSDSRLHVGSAVQLTRIVRLPGNHQTGCPIMADGMEIVYLNEDAPFSNGDTGSDNLSGEPELEPDSPPMMVERLPSSAPDGISRSTSGATDVTMATDTTVSSNASLNYPVDTITAGFEVLQQQNMQLIAQYNNEHRRRRLLEHVLATVCRDLAPGDKRPSAAFSEAMELMSELVSQAGAGSAPAVA